ncbi:MAG TPA: zinc metalloprotease HtpX [Candidatus Aminicenantes bacterium]|nr:zinc metalloprotease HtpX [Candidatus Aminicenantes bacterium]
MATRPRDFYEVQRRQRRRSLPLFGAVLAFHFVGFGLIGLALLATFGLAFRGGLLSAPGFWPRFLLADLAVAVVTAALHFLDARKNGPRFILKRLQAQTPDASDRYHLQLLNTVDEIRIAAGLPRVNAYVLPSFAVNSLAVIEEDGTPAVAVTEGLLAEGTRDELQAVAAHELAHIARGDAFYLTLVCSLAHLFEKLKDALEPETDDRADCPPAGRRTGPGFPPVLFYAAVAVSALVMRLLSMLVSRERELLADAAAVELSRAPEALARIIYKAHVKNSFVGDFPLSYAPLFIVRPDARDTPDTLAGRILSSHPPLMKRIGLLAAMVRKKPPAIAHAVWAEDKARADARGVLRSYEEQRTEQLELFPAAPGAGDAPPAAGDEARVWMLAGAGDGPWEGPFTVPELLCRPRFSPAMRVKNTQEGIEARAREFPQVRTALFNLARKKPLSPGRENLCPRCRVPLAEAFYEGVAVRVCGRCRGRLVDAASVDRIVARRELAFSEALVAKARAFRDKVTLNPLKRQKIEAALDAGVPCPSCGYRMVARPYNYQYFVPVDKCLSCSKIWFDADEMEVLQVLIEDRAAK